MRMHFGCACGGLSRRQVLGGFAAAAASTMVGQSARAQTSAQTSAPATLKGSGVRTVDIHAHYFTQSFFDVIKAEGARFNAEATVTERNFSFKTPGGSQSEQPLKFIDLKQRLADMDEQGIAVHALSLTTPMVYWADGEVSLKLARAWNDGAIAAHKEHPERFVVLVTLPMLDPDRAIEELNRVSDLPGVRGVYMGTNINGRDLDDPLFQPIFARIEALDLPVFLHPLQVMGGNTTRLRGFHLANLIGNPVDSTIAASRLIFGGVLDRFPRLQVNLPHAGGALPILIGRIDHGWKVRAENKHLQHAPSSYLRRFTYDTVSHSKPIMEFIISQVGADRIMIGSDYCYDMGYERPVQVVEALGLSPDEKKMILGGTAAKILKLQA